MRLELDSKEAAMEWLRRFEASSYTTLSVQRTYPHCKTKNVFRVRMGLYIYIYIYSVCVCVCAHACVCVEEELCFI